MKDARNFYELQKNVRRKRIEKKRATRQSLSLLFICCCCCVNEKRSRRRRRRFDFLKRNLDGKCGRRKGFHLNQIVNLSTHNSSSLVGWCVVALFSHTQLPKATTIAYTYILSLSLYLYFSYNQQTNE